MHSPNLSSKRRQEYLQTFVCLIYQTMMTLNPSPKVPPARSPLVANNQLGQSSPRRRSNFSAAAAC